MDKKTVFRLAIERARENGWYHFVGGDHKHFSHFLTLLEDEQIDIFFTKQEQWAMVLFDNCFCRAFWGTEYLVPIGKVIQHKQMSLRVGNLLGVANTASALTNARFREKRSPVFLS
jgi:hypothetical protein